LHWEFLTSKTPLYAKDNEGTLFDEDVHEMNLDKLDSMFSTEGNWYTEHNRKPDLQYKTRPKGRKIGKPKLTYRTIFRNTGGSGLLNSWRYAGSFASGFPGIMMQS
jgi:hypothetical protein